MRFYLVRHGEAVPRAVASARPLSERGRDDVARVAAFARSAGVEVHQICHSEKCRAGETAAILAEYLDPAGGVASVPGLRPEEHVRPIADVLNRATRSLMVVGHYPHLVRLSGLLLAGSKRSAVVDFQMGSMACLERNRGARNWLLCWLVAPDLLPER